jgi:hypothetical protein
MAYNKDWFPARREDQLAMAGTWARVLLSSNPPRFGVPAAEAATGIRRTKTTGYSTARLPRTVTAG